MQWQHGAYTMFQNGSLLLDPIAVDGRQLVSDPCKLDIGMYSRYNQSELFKVLSAPTFHSCYIYSADTNPVLRRFDRPLPRRPPVRSQGL